MTISKIDPTAALIVVDLQKGILGFPTVHPAAGVVERAAALAAAFRARGLPVILVTVDGVPPGRTERGFAMAELPDGFCDLAPELGAQPGDYRITKQTWGAFTGTGLEETLRGRGVTQVVLAGIATSAGVESTARQAHELGFDVVLALDAMTDMDGGAHANSAERVFPMLGETGLAQDVIDRLG